MDSEGEKTLHVNLKALDPTCCIVCTGANCVFYRCEMQLRERSCIVVYCVGMYLQCYQSRTKDDVDATLPYLQHAVNRSELPVICSAR